MKRLRWLSIVLSIVFVGVAMCACGHKDTSDPTPTAPLNGGFESGDLSGWIVEYGDAFDDDCVSSERTFVFADDVNHNELSIGATGNWYLTGKGYDGKYSGARTGALRSTSFVVPDDGYLAFRLAGGALTVGKGENAAYKDEEKLCFVGVYLASNDRMIARRTNEYFLEHTEDYVNARKYETGVYHTDNFCDYELDLKAWAGETVYLRIVDNDTSRYYGYLAVDDIRVGRDSEAQTEGAFYTKITAYETETPETSPYEIANGGFETGSLAGWTVVEGDAFSNEGVNAESVWWNENIPYDRDGAYHYGYYRPTATGTMRSSEFVLGGTGYVSWKLGGCMDNGKTYLRFMVVEGDNVREVARFSNEKYRNFQFPYVPNGMRLLNMVQYYTDLSLYLGNTMYIEVVDNNESADELGCITLDSVKTFWSEKPVWYDSESFFTVSDSDIMPESAYQVENGGFETGDLTGWTLSDADAPIGVVTSDFGWWEENFPYNKKGACLFSGIAHEQNTGTLTSSAFTVGGAGWMTFLFGGGRAPDLCHISIVDADDGTELLRFANKHFRDHGTSGLNADSFLANMVLYRADLGALIGRRVKIVVTDMAKSNWGLVTVDSFVTYYASAEAVPEKAELAVDLLSQHAQGSDDEYQVLNGDFETGDLTGWTQVGNFGGLSAETVWWNENISFEKEGEYFFSGMEGVEADIGTLESTAFTVGGAGWMTFRLGGGKNTELCYLELVDADTGSTLARFGNTLFSDVNFASIQQNPGTAADPVHAAEYDVFMANMILFKADLSDWMGKQIKIRLVDNATGDWGFLFADSFVTHYETVDALPAEAVSAESIF